MLAKIEVLLLTCNRSIATIIFIAYHHPKQTMSRFILIGPPKIGKSVAANRIADALGCANIKYEWDAVSHLPENTLAITNNPNWDRIPDITLLVVGSSETLHTLVDALERKPVIPEQLKIAKQLEDLAAWLDGNKNFMSAASGLFKETTENIETLHTCAMHIAGNRVAEIYSPEEGAQS